MKIENIELLEVFIGTVCDVAEAQPFDPLSLPYPAGSSTLAQLQGDAENPLLNLAQRYDDLGNSSLAQATRQIAEILNTHSLISDNKADTPGRLLDYVYPVV